VKVTPSLLRYTYKVLKSTAFHDIAVPLVDFEVSPLRKAWGYYYSNPPKIQIAKSITSPQRLLMVVAHEMVHGDHGKDFRDLGEIICKRMGWCAKEF
jgi:predicted metal-dependent hydrolase